MTQRYRCPRCKGTNVEMQVWYDPNAGEVTDLEAGTHDRCNDCDSELRKGELEAAPDSDCDVCEGTGVFGMYVQHDNSGAFVQVGGVNGETWEDGWVEVQSCGQCHRFASDDAAAAFWFERWDYRGDNCGCDDCEAAPDGEEPHRRSTLVVDPESLRNRLLSDAPAEGARWAHVCTGACCCFRAHLTSGTATIDYEAGTVCVHEMIPSAMEPGAKWCRLCGEREVKHG